MMRTLRNHVWLLVVLIFGSISYSANAQDRRPPELDVQYHRAETAWKSGASVLEAKARVDRVLKEIPDDAEALKLRAQVLMAMKRPKEALADARQAVGLTPQDGEAFLILSEAARLNGDEKLAIDALDAAAERVMEGAEFHIRLSWNAALLGQLERAEAFARIAHNAEPGRAAAYYQLARVFVMKNQNDDAAAILAKGLRGNLLDPAAIQRDTVLTRVSGHEALSGLLK
jgi:tetratricopeptide (TPR) repeat protein